MSLTAYVVLRVGWGWEWQRWTHPQDTSVREQVNRLTPMGTGLYPEGFSALHIVSGAVDAAGVRPRLVQLLCRHGSMAQGQGHEHFTKATFQGLTAYARVR